MPNHVHLLVTPHVVAANDGPEEFTSHQANRILGLEGWPFWQDKSYDRVVRSELEFERIRDYIEQNPVTAGLARQPISFDGRVRGWRRPAESRLRPRLAAPLAGKTK